MPDPYFNAPYWKKVVTQINAQAPGTVDGVHLQTYAGGQGNSPCVGWDFGDVPVFPFVWDLDDTVRETYRQMNSWHDQCGIVGGGLWIYDDLVGTNKTSQYAKFETYRQQIDGVYWFPTYTISESTLHFPDDDVPIRQTIKYEDYKQFRSDVKITFGDEVQQKEDKKHPEPPKRP